MFYALIQIMYIEEILTKENELTKY